MKPILVPKFFCLHPGKITNHGDAKNNTTSTLDTAFADPDCETICQKRNVMIPIGIGDPFGSSADKWQKMMTLQVPHEPLVERVRSCRGKAITHLSPLRKSLAIHHHTTSIALCA